MIKKETFKKIMGVVFGNEPHDVQGEILREIFIALKDVDNYERSDVYNILLEVLNEDVKENEGE